MAMKLKKEVFGAPTKNILAIPDHYVALAHTVTSADEAVKEENGRKVLKAGTVYPKNDETAKGIVFSDYDLTDGDAQVAIIVHGFVLEEALPEAISEEAQAVLPMILAVPRVK